MMVSFDNFCGSDTKVFQVKLLIFKSFKTLHLFYQDIYNTWMVIIHVQILNQNFGFYGYNYYI